MPEQHKRRRVYVCEGVPTLIRAIPSVYPHDRPATIVADPHLVHPFIRSALEFARVVVVLLLYITQRWRFYKGRGGGWNPTLTFINVVYFYFISYGVGKLYKGCMHIAVLGDTNVGIADCVLGVINAAPYIVALLYGRHRLFKVMARRFEDKRRGLDSAIIAVRLVDFTTLRRGADWWIHHGNNCAEEFPDLFDHRRNWTRAVVVEIEDNRYSINPNVVQRRLDVGFAHGSLLRGGGGRSHSGHRRSVTAYEVAPRGGRGRSVFSGRGRSSVTPNKVAPVPATLEWIARHDDARENAVGLLTKAHDSLRTLGGRDLTRGLMATYEKW